MKKGDHVYVDRGLYTHHGIYTGNGKVIHSAGFTEGNSGKIEVVSIRDFSDGDKVLVKNHDYKTYSRDEVVKRAMSKIGEDEYDLLGNNCEHFAYWSISGVKKSDQALIAMAVGMVATPVVKMIDRKISKLIGGKK